MRKLAYKGNDKFVIETVADPIPSINEVVVSMKVAALCGSDLHIKEAHDDHFKNDPHYIPVTPSHEPAGIVAAVGAGVTGFSVGDRVAVYHKIGCNYCENCRAGNIVYCKSGGALSGEFDGAAADYLKVPKENCLKLPDSISFEDGAILMCAGGTSYSGLKKIELQPGETVGIFGVGPIGLATLLFAKAIGAYTICVDIDKKRLELANKLGANVIINSSSDKNESEVYELIHGFRVNASTTTKKIYELTKGKGLDCAVECSSAESARVNAIDSLAKQGRVVFLGLNNQYRYGKSFQKSIEPEKIIFKELRVYGSNVFPLPMYYEIVKFMEAKRVSFSPMVTHRFLLNQGSQAFQMAASKDSGKVLFVWP